MTNFQFFRVTKGFCGTNCVKCGAPRDRDSVMEGRDGGHERDVTPAYGESGGKDV